VIGAAAQTQLWLASLTLGPIQFDRPIWLWLIPITWALSIWIGLRSLSGLGSLTRRVAIAVRLIVLALVACALAEPQWRRTSEDVSVTVVLDASRSVPQRIQAQVDRFLDEASASKRRIGDRLGMVTAARDAYVQKLPSRYTEQLERQHIGAIDGTNLDEAVRLALAVVPQDAANRVLLITDGNETEGSLLRAAEAAKALGIPIDILPVQFHYEREVMAERLDVPATARMGQALNLRVSLVATRATTGRLSLLINGEPIDLDPDAPGMGVHIALEPGRNHRQIPLTIVRAGPQEFQAVFEPDDPDDDTIAENNTAMGVTFVSSEGRVLLYADDPVAAAPLERALTQAQIAAEVATAQTGPQSLTQLNAYDAIILLDQQAYSFSEAQQEQLRQYVHDSGGGLVMIGGPSSFGAGGWIGTRLEDALPLLLDPPQKRQMPRGALVLVMHSIEMPDGVHYGKKTAEAAINALTRLDMAGIVEYVPFKGKVTWVHPLREIGDGASFKRAINNLTFGDMPDMAPSLRVTLAGLIAVSAGQKHVIVISDGDPSPPSNALLQKFVDNNITISTVGVYPHSPGDFSRLKRMATYTGGRFYGIQTKAGLAQIYQIFVKEAQTVRRPLIWEGDPIVPTLADPTTAGMRGITAVPPLSGYVVTAERPGLARVVLRGNEDDPILAQWQYGLGRAVAFTSGADTRWTPDWIAWDGFRAFWEQHVRWAMRPSGSANVRVQTITQGDHTVLKVRALDADGDPLNFARWKGRVSTPDGQGRDVDLRQVGPGQYEGDFKSDQAGSYVASLRYIAPGPGGQAIEGTVQAAVTRPFADEFRALQDNAPLLEQVRATTGGRVIDPEPDKADLWSREGLTMPVATRPIWLLAALIAVGTFLVDVGVRRVRLDIPAMARWVVGLFHRSTGRAGAQMDSLRAARDKARLRTAATPVDPQEAKQVAGKKFEASPEELARKQTGPVAVTGQAAPIQMPKKESKGKESAQEEEAMSRLLKAKKRARDEFGDEA